MYQQKICGLCVKAALGIAPGRSARATSHLPEAILDLDAIEISSSVATTDPYTSFPVFCWSLCVIVSMIGAVLAVKLSVFDNVAISISVPQRQSQTDLDHFNSCEIHDWIAIIHAALRHERS